MRLTEVSKRAEELSLIKATLSLAGEAIVICGTHCVSIVIPALLVQDISLNLQASK